MMANRRGPKSSVTAAIADEIVLRLSDGEPLRQICRDEHMPGWVSVYRWMDAAPENAERIARARELGEDAIAQECMDIADNARNDWMERSGEDSAGWQLNGEHIQRSKLRIDTRLKLLAKWNPKRWGEKVQNEHSGPDGGAVQFTVISGVPRS
jgi:hypothetical protein